MKRCQITVLLPNGGQSERLKHQSADATADSSTSASKKRRSAWIEQKRVFKSQSPRMNPILALHDPPALLADVVVVLGMTGEHKDIDRVGVF